MKPFDIAPFALPDCAPGELRFEEPRDITAVHVTFRERVQEKIGIEYLRNRWPEIRHELHRDLENPAGFGWQQADDQWNGTWQRAATLRSDAGRKASFTFQPLTKDGMGRSGGPREYNVSFRRTLGLKIRCADPASLRAVEVFTSSPAECSRLRVTLDAGRRTPGAGLRLSAYNARVDSIAEAKGVRAQGNQIRLGKARTRSFELDVSHMAPAHPYSGDDPLLTFSLSSETFTLSVQDLAQRGPVWFAELGVFVTLAGDGTSFADYRARFRGRQTTIRQIASQAEQSFAGAFHGQPRAHAVNFSFGCALSPQRFWLEANGDLVLHRGNLDFLGKRPELAAGMRTRGTARFFFGMERWIPCARYANPGAVPIYNQLFRKDALFAEQTTLCVPLRRPIGDGPLGYEEPTAALLRFRFANRGDKDERAALPVGYSQDSERSSSGMMPGPAADEYRVPVSVRDAVTLADGMIRSRQDGQEVLRAVYASSSMAPGQTADGRAALVAALAPGETCEALLTVPFVAPAREGDLGSLRGLDFADCCRDVSAYWLAEGNRGSQLGTPVAHLDAVHRAHLSHILYSDIAMPGKPSLVNTSVGSSTYGNFANEACMILQELDQRGLGDEVERRLQVFVDYAGTAKQPGNFVDFEGSFYGAGDWECGDYNQHHGWALWYLAEHFLLTGNRAWFQKVAGAVVAGADWVFRQRAATMKRLPHSRGWEKGFLPAGSLEDVTEFHYWLSTNSLTWRGTDAAARALEAAGHPEAPRIRRESDAFRLDLLCGFTLARQHAPLVPLRDGRWVPHFPSRLYRRGRDLGWIREVLEGAVYLIVSGLIDPGSREAGWILDDYQDNLYHTPPYGYVMRDPAQNLRNRGGFSIQPNLLAGLIPHLERDEIEVYLWMFFNAWVSCYREEVDGMIEHPMPELGFDNATAFKTSDEANAVAWLRAIVVYSTPRFLHLGRAIPRAWFRDGEETRVTNVRTHYGRVSARWSTDLSHGKIVLEAELREGPDAPRFLARFRHPAAVPIASVEVNGKAWTRFDPVRGDVDVTGLRGEIRIVASYG